MTASTRLIFTIAGCGRHHRVPRGAAAVAKRALCVSARQPLLLHVWNKKKAIKATTAADWSQTTTTTAIMTTTTNNTNTNTNTNTA